MFQFNVKRPKTLFFKSIPHRFIAVVANGYFFHLIPLPSGWTHVVLNYIGPDNGQGIRIYYDGDETGSEVTLYSDSNVAGNGRIVIGRFETDRYGSVQLNVLQYNVN